MLLTIEVSSFVAVIAFTASAFLAGGIVATWMFLRLGKTKLTVKE